MISDDKQLITQTESEMYWNTAERLIDKIIRVNYDELNLIIYA